MTEGLAIEIACAKMRELGVGKDYLIRYRHFQLQALKSMDRKHPGELMILLTPDPFTQVTSTMGVFDQTDRRLKEMQYVFSDRFTITNLNTKQAIQVKFLQVIPLLKSE